MPSGQKEAWSGQQLQHIILVNKFHDYRQDFGFLTVSDTVEGGITEDAIFVEVGQVSDLSEITGR